MASPGASSGALIQTITGSNSRLSRGPVSFYPMKADRNNRSRLDDSAGSNFDTVDSGYERLSKKRMQQNPSCAIMQSKSNTFRST